MPADPTFDPYDPALVGLLFCPENTMKRPVNENSIAANDNFRRGA